MVHNLSVDEIFPTIRSDTSSESLKRLNVVLNAVTDIIKAKNAPIHPTSYFALILASLTENSYKQGQKSDLLKLLSIVISRITIGIVRSNSDNIISLCLKIVQEESKDEHIMKPTLVLIGHVLTMSESSAWQVMDRRNAYSALLACAVDERSKLRHKALEQIILVLNSVGASNPTGVGLLPAVSQMTTKFCLDIFANVTSSTMQRAFYAMSVAHDLIPQLQPSLVSQLLDVIIKMTSLGNSAITPICYRTIGSLFLRTNQLKAEHVHQIIQVLYSHPPSGIDTKATVAYTELLTRANLSISRMNRTISNQNIHQYFKHLISNFSSDKLEITRITMEGFKNVIYECINEEVITQGVNNLNGNSPLRLIIDTLESSTKYTFKHSWELILSVLSAMFEQLGKNAYPLLNNILISLDAMNQLPDLHCRQALHSVFSVAMVAIGPKNFLTLMPLNLDAPPNSRDKERINRNWLLQVMRDSIKFTELQFFIDYFLPMTKMVKQKSKESESDGKSIESKNLNILYNQIWDLLPGFLNQPTDLPSAFKNIARLIGSSLQDDVELRSVICTAFTNMLNHLVESRDAKTVALFVPLKKRHVTMDVKLAEDSIKTIAHYAKNYLPIFFNIYPVSNHEQRSQIIDTIEAYIGITDKATLGNMFKSLITKLLEALKEEGIEKKQQKEGDDKMDATTAVEEKKKSKKYYLTDLTVGFVKHLDDEQVKTLYKVIKPQLRCSDSGLQKRSFKVLVKICEYHAQFIVQNMDKIKSTLVTDLMQSTSNIKKTRLKCLKEILVTITRANKEAEEQAALEEEEALENGEEPVEEENKPSFRIKSSWTQLKKKFIPSVLPEVILCTKESNNRLREISNEILIECANIMCLIGQKLAVAKRGVTMEDTIAASKEESMKEYLHMMAAGLAATTTHMVCATIIAMTRVVHNFRRMINPALIEQMTSALIVLTGSPNRDVVKAVLGFTRVVMACFKDIDVVETHLQTLIASMAKWAELDKNFFRTIIQILLERLMKRYGFDRIHGCPTSSEEFKKIVANIKKKKDRAERKREEEEAALNKMIDPVTGSDVKSARGSVYGGDDDDEQQVGDESDDSDDDIEQFLFNVKKANKQAANENNWIVEEGDDPIDFLDRNAISKIASNKSGKQTSGSARQLAVNNKGRAQSDAYETNEDGKLVIVDSDDEEEKRKQRKRQRGPSYIDEVFEEQAQEYEAKAGYRATKAKGALKRASNNDDSDDEDDGIDEDLRSAFTKKTFATAKTGKTARTTKTTKTTMTGKTGKSDGRSEKNLQRIDSATERYNRVRGINTNVNLDAIGRQPKKGDIKGNTKQKLEPYAYIPLDPKTLNKRSKQSSSSSYKNILKKRKKD
ncbi:hypothetical protein PPL_03418 [Heterostelium album PN500]|uniref:Ribosomal RNA-processing protein 12-like conserved domain-containing protein n=1 Tax=Heterostelium pallidum (strain ATCC 26659 / Pp 5 / PN500) TaxID=670386 RepID=D3B4U2_HETP5|nr:hypothetical protein PPL_03418 [Heterostelium album PN500]EFA84340.1 hypothetical protein PPL_03418 [Heterostelium album PN500]|eukprot:XP_020436455.1 hypothetical protein PPL_03418 [Heterostelium album PN500]